MLIASVAGTVASPQESTGDSVITPQQQISLFNGTNLDGLYTWLVDSGYSDPRNVFTVTNGMIRISGDGLGYISTRRAYRNYQLIVEFRWGNFNSAWGDRIGKARDSGIFLHSIGPDGNSEDGQGAFRAAIECNIFQGAVGDFLLIRGRGPDGELLAPRISVPVAPGRDAEGWPTFQRGGDVLTLERWGRVNWFGKSAAWKDELGFRGPRDLERPAGQWNRIRCVCDGRRIRIFVNGRLANEAFDVHPAAGHILLQCEGSEIFFRRFELQPLKNAGSGVGTAILPATSADELE